MSGRPDALPAHVRAARDRCGGVPCTNGGLHQRWLDVHPAWQAHHIVAAQLRLTEELQRRRAHEMEEAKVRGRG